jgi:hypothetical protein
MSSTGSSMHDCPQLTIDKEMLQGCMGYETHEKAQKKILPLMLAVDVNLRQN